MASDTLKRVADSDADLELYYQQASMLILVFRFKHRRKLVASRLMETRNFALELERHLPVLEHVYQGHEVAKVEIVSYQWGGFYYDEWKGGLKRVWRHYRRRLKGVTV